MASTIFEVLDSIEKGRKYAIKNAKLANLPATDDMGIHDLGDLFLMQNNEEQIFPSGDWVRPNDWWDTKTILQNAEIKDGLYPAYILLLTNMEDTTTFSKTATNKALAGDGYLTSDGVWYPTTQATHTWDKTQDKECSEGYKTRYVIVYVANKTNISTTINLRNFPCLEFIADDITIKENGLIFGASSVPRNMQIINIECTEKTIIGATASYFVNSCYSLRNISIPNLEKTNTYFAQSCVNLTNVYLPKLNYLPNSCFSSCSNLESISLPSLQSCGSGLFQSCINLKNVDLPNLEIMNGGNHFSGCDNLESISLPNLETVTGSNPFNSNKVKFLYLPNLVSTQDSAFSGCYNLESISLPSLETIGGSTFSACHNLKNLSMPKLTTMGQRTFYSNYGIEEYTFLSTTTSINVTQMFYQCYNLKRLNLYNDWKITGLDITDCTQMLKDSLNDMLYKLADVTGESGTYTLTLGATNLAKLTADEIAVGTNKGWTIN